MITWLGALLAGPALVLGPVFPGFGTLDRHESVPDRVGQAIERVDLTPDTGGRVAFNDPLGSRDEKYALVRRVESTIRSADDDATIRMAAYSFALPSVAEALLDAHERGVSVQVVVDDHSRHWKPVAMLEDGLGTDTSAASFLRTCRLSCRGGGGNQHAKFLTIDATSRGDGLVMVGSMNLTDFSNERQWNDLYWVTDPEIHAQFSELFSAMVRDRPQRRMTLPTTVSGLQTDVSPYAASGGDPLRARLRQVHCRGAADGTGRDGRTVVRISMHAWNKDRGIALARQVAGLAREGCDVRVLYGVGTGPQVAAVLDGSGVAVRDSAESGRRVHEKLMILSGRYADRRDARFVWTGSHNWTDRSVRNDEIMLRVAGPSVVRAYLANFDHIWALSD